MTVSTLVSVTALPDAASSVLTLVAVVTDLTELKRRDEVIAQGKLLRESEDRRGSNWRKFKPFMIRRVLAGGPG